MKNKSVKQTIKKNQAFKSLMKSKKTLQAIKLLMNLTLMIKLIAKQIKAINYTQATQ